MYVASTLVGVSVLAVLFTLIGMLLWMKMRVNVPPVLNILALDGSDSLFVHIPPTAPEPRKLPPELQAFPEAGDMLLRHDTPEPVRRLIAKGLADPTCPATIVHVGRDKNWVTAIGLGRYPGMFRLVRRDLERRSRKGTLPYAVAEHNGKSILVHPEHGAMALFGTTLIIAPDAGTLKSCMDAVLKGPPVPLDWATPQDRRAMSVQGWLRATERLSLRTDGEQSPWLRLLAQMVEAFPELAKARSWSITGSAAQVERPADGLLAEFTLRLEAQEGADTALGDAVAAWLRESNRVRGWRIAAEVEKPSGTGQIHIAIKVTRQEE